jgi:acetyl esterase/lipase
VNPEVRPALQQLLKTMSPMPDANASTLPPFRQMSSQWAAPLLPSPKVREQMIPGPKGAPQVRVYVIGDSTGASKPAVLHIHGGGYISGSAAANRRDLQELVLAQNSVVVSVDYRLAPETRFPGSLEDNYAALKWMYQNAADLGIDTRRIAVKGESAGGGHAAMLAIAVRDRGEFALCLQVLIYPMLDDRTGSKSDLPPQFGAYIWSPGSNRFGWSSLLGVPAGSTDVPTGSVPARAADLSSLAPAFIGVGSIDLFAPEDMKYAQRLMLAGVPTELTVVPGAFHGFDGIAPEAGLSREFNRAWNDALRRAFLRT